MSDIFMTTVPMRGKSGSGTLSPGSVPAWGNGNSGGPGAGGSGGIAPAAGDHVGAQGIPGDGESKFGLLLAVPAVVATAYLVVNGMKILSKKGGGRRSVSPQSPRDLATEDGRPGPSPTPAGASPPPAATGVGGGTQRGQRSVNTSNSRWKKGKLIGRGAFGSVYTGMDSETGELLAIKEMDAQGAEELRTEFNLLKELQHEHVVQIKAFEIYGGKARLYLEWVASGSLSDVVSKFGQVRESRLKAYVKQILLGLSFLHEHGILHRDIKPKNILVDNRGVLKLTDFGLSRHLNSINPTTRPCGTPVYMAPECVKGQFSIGSDIWAVGATVCELATGELPWSHLDKNAVDNNYALMYHIGNLAGQRGHHPHIPDHLSEDGRDFLKKCFAPDPADRGTCAELLRHSFLQDAGSPIRPLHSASTEAIASSSPVEARGAGYGSATLHSTTNATGSNSASNPETTTGERSTATYYSQSEEGTNFESALTGETSPGLDGETTTFQTQESGIEFDEDEQGVSVSGGTNQSAAAFP